MQGKTSPGPIVAAFLSCLFGSVLLGVVTNIWNAQVSPIYFTKIMFWEGDIVAMSAVQAMLEGSLSGLVLGGIVATVYTIRSAGCGTVGNAIKLSAILLGFAFIDWLVGGGVGMLAGLVGPDWFSAAVRRHIFRKRVEGGVGWRFYYWASNGRTGDDHPWPRYLLV